MISIVLADDHPVVRRGLRGFLEADPEVRVVGEASNGLEAVQLVNTLRPTILILDLVMPGLGGLEVTQRVSQNYPDTNIIILSIHANEAYVLEAMRSGASAYVLKDASSGDLVDAVRKVAAGGRYLSPPLSDRAVAAYVAKTAAAPPGPLSSLTTRERAVLRLAAEGQTSAEIAARLGISPRTAEAHRAHLMRKTGLHNQTELLRFAMRHGILPSE